MSGVKMTIEAKKLSTESNLADHSDDVASVLASPLERSRQVVESGGSRVDLIDGEPTGGSESVVPAPKGRQREKLTPEGHTKSAVRKDYLVFFIALHALALLAVLPFFFSWAGVAAFLIGVVAFGQMAIPIGYHRLLSHRSFKSPRWFERSLVTLAMCTAQETPAHWVAWHRMHHSHSDHHEDPHSPRISFLWAHVQWLVHETRTPLATYAMYEKYAKDILADPYYRWLEKLPVAAGIFYFGHAILYAIVANLACLAIYGNTPEAYRMAASLFVWGVILRTVWVWHITWAVNSLTHVFGYRNYDTTDDSRNNWFVTLLTAGEGWHNNHHADPSSASVQHRWWEIDINYYTIRLFGVLGLATDIIPPRHVRKQRSLASKPR
ncbi:Fatty acid desaturase [Rubripirellula lacrimiformis]|uniref:Fatty acid desaturase n=1 Tax=Rubripirellula lacrimiformis TaxID=1930273 RepID=A0A517NER5_9BACT|nr:fatty acid desaturase [Rubripirellula lacrimiformis]QDT05615.1 Fatty acid desaturase [Rubripirellula lacrimiformis]